MKFLESILIEIKSKSGGIFKNVFNSILNDKIEAILLMFHVKTHVCVLMLKIHTYHVTKNFDFKKKVVETCFNGVLI